MDERRNLAEGLAGDDYIFEEEVREADLAKRLKPICCFFIVSALALPVTTWFAGPHYYAFIGGCAFAAWQLLLGSYGYCCGFRTRSFFRCMVSLYFLVFFPCLLLYEGGVLAYTIINNDDDCGVFKLNKVCDKREGIMATQMILFMLLPALDALVFIAYRACIRSIDQIKSRS